MGWLYKARKGGIINSNGNLIGGDIGVDKMIILKLILK
jgi:hypothetical protein